MSKLLRVNGSSSAVCEQTGIVTQGLGEVADLESWIVDHPEVLDPSMKVITIQFNRWASVESAALERPDIIGLTTSGELVVIELKRVADKNVHLQALTYAALASSFTLGLLAEEHASWYNKTHSPDDRMTPARAREELENFMESDVDLEEALVFVLPKILLVAPEFPAQVLTTVQWLDEVAPDVLIECHEYRLFSVPGENEDMSLVVNFNRIFPVQDVDERRLRAQSPRVVAAREQQRSRMRNTVDRILANDLIPDGAELVFDPSQYVDAETMKTLRDWFAAEPSRTDFRWNAHSKKSIQWGSGPDQVWTPTGLRNELFTRAGLPNGTFAAPRTWFYAGESLPEIAKKASPELWDGQ